jgi:hypothetical protein
MDDDDYEAISNECDRCGFEELIDPNTTFRHQTGLAAIAVGLLDYDLCPSCWQTIGPKPKQEKPTE